MELLTRNGHNMYDMASMMQKAIRRGYVKHASYAAYELYGRYYRYVWRRLMVISAEDCYGIMTKEILALKLADDEVNDKSKGYDRDPIFLAKAVLLLCMARKNRDACYVGCNFMYPDKVLDEDALNEYNPVTEEELQRMKIADDKIPDWVFDIHTIKGKYKLGKNDLDMTIDEEKALYPHQFNLFDYGDWNEYYEKEISEGNIDKKQQEDVKEFQKTQKALQKAYGTEENFIR